MLLQKKKYSYFILFAAAICGASIPISTAAQNIGAALLIIYFITKLNNLYLFKITIIQPFSLAGIALGVALVLGIFSTTASQSEAWRFLIKLRAYYFIPIFLFVLSEEKIRNVFLISFAIGTTISIIISILSAFFNYPVFMAVHGDWFIFRTHTYHNYFAALLCAGIFAGLLSKTIPTPWRAIAIAIFLLGSLDIFFLVSGRTGQIIFLLMLLLIFIQWNWRIGVSIGGLITVTIFLILINFSNSVNQGINKAKSDINLYLNGDSNTPVGLRLEWQKTSIQLIKEKPFFGHGTGSFKNEYNKKIKFNNKLQESNNPHNDYLWLGVELGMTGIFLLISLLLTAAWQGRNLKKQWRWILYSMLMGMAISTLANSFFTDNITGTSFVLLTCALLNGPKNSGEYYAKYNYSHPQSKSS